VAREIWATVVGAAVAVPRISDADALEANPVSTTRIQDGPLTEPGCGSIGQMNHPRCQAQVGACEGSAESLLALSPVEGPHPEDHGSWCRSWRLG
jgi:hypothetical protein